MLLLQDGSRKKVKVVSVTDNLLGRPSIVCVRDDQEENHFVPGIITGMKYDIEKSKLKVEFTVKKKGLKLPTNASIKSFIVLPGLGKGRGYFKVK